MTTTTTTTNDANATIKYLSRRISVDAYSGCWTWRLGRTHDGYARCCYRYENWLVHRLAWTALYGTIPSDLEIDHLCRVRHCVNPAHLEPVAHAENMRRAVVDECRKCGEPYSVVSIPSATQRYCLSCRRKRRHAYYMRQKAKRAELQAVS